MCSSTCGFRPSSWALPGPLLLDGILTQEVFLAGFIILMSGVLTVVGTLVSDILRAVVDPRIKVTRQ